MGVGYSASALHMISYYEPIPGAPPDPTAEPPPPGLMAAVPDAIWDTRPHRWRSPTVPEIVAWRRGISARYHDQLGGDLIWDEGSDFERSEDVGTSADVMLRYVAAILDQRGPAEARALRDTTEPPHRVMDPVFTEIERRGFSSRFPHLLLGPDYWLPFDRNLMIEEPNWNGDLARYGSLFRLAEELAEVRTFIGEADFRAMAWGADREVPEDILAAAWQASDTIWRLCTNAMTQHLPLWTTG